MVLRGCHTQINKDEDARDYQPCLEFIDGRISARMVGGQIEQPQNLRVQDASKGQGCCKAIGSLSRIAGAAELKLHDVTYIPNDAATFLQRAGRAPMDVRDCLFVPSRNTRHCERLRCGSA